MVDHRDLWGTDDLVKLFKCTQWAAFVVAAGLAVSATAAISDYSGIYSGGFKNSKGKVESTCTLSMTKGGRGAGGFQHATRGDVEDLIAPASTVARSDGTFSGATVGGGTIKGTFTVSKKSGKLAGTAKGDKKYTFTLTRIYK